MSNLGFNDVPESHWARRFIYFLTDRGIVSGYPDGKFGPEDSVTIEQFCALAVNSANIPPFYGTSWENPEGRWSGKYIDYVEKEKGILLSHDKPSADALDAPIQRQFAFSIAWRIVASASSEHDDYNEAAYNDDKKFPFTDKGDVLACNREGAFQLVRNKIISGFPDGTLGPKATLSRAEAAAMLSRCIVSDQVIEAFMDATVSVPLNVKTRTYYDFPVSVHNMPVTSKRVFAITYNPYKLAVDDLCVSADKKILDVGNVSGAKVSILSFEPDMGFVSFKYTGDVPGTGLTGIINTIRFRSMDSGNTTFNAGISI